MQARANADTNAVSATRSLTRSPVSAIKADYDETSRKYFPKSYRPTDGLRFNSSDALFPEGTRRRRNGPRREGGARP